MKGQKTLKKARRSHSGIDFESCAQIVTTSDDAKKMEYSQLKATRKYAIKNAFMGDVDVLFHKHAIGEESDRVEVLQFVEKQWSLLRLTGLRCGIAMLQQVVAAHTSLLGSQKAQVAQI